MYWKHPESFIYLFIFKQNFVLDFINNNIFIMYDYLILYFVNIYTFIL